MFQIPEFTSRSTNNDSIHTNCPVKYFAIIQFENDLSYYDITLIILKTYRLQMIQFS